MAHEIEAFAYTGQRAWHGLGNELTQGQPIEVWMREAGFNFEVKEAPVHFFPVNGQMTEYDGQKVLYRSDTLNALSVVTDRYKVVQPSTVLEFYRSLVNIHGYELESAGLLRQGKRIFALAKTGIEGKLKGNDRIKAYLLLCTSYDGSLATTCQFTAIRVVCANTLAIAMSDASGAIKVPHSTVFDASAVKRDLGLETSWESFMEQVRAMSEKKIRTATAKRYLDEVLGEPELAWDKQPREKLLGNVMDLYAGKAIGSDLDSAKGTVFGLLNAVTETVDHHARARSADGRLNSAWFGPGATVKAKAFDEALKLATA